MSRTFKIDTKDGTGVAEGDSPLAITGLAPDTVVATGDYVVIAIENGVESDPVDIPGFTVLSEVIAVTGVSLDQETLSLAPGGSATLVATVMPEDATDKTGTWASTDETVATVVDGTVTVDGAAAVDATAELSFTTTDGEFVATSTLTVVAEALKRTTRKTRAKKTEE